MDFSLLQQHGGILQILLTINFVEAFLLFLVLIPRAFLPQGVIGDLRPIGCLPSPPP